MRLQLPLYWKLFQIINQPTYFISLNLQNKHVSKPALMTMKCPHFPSINADIYLRLMDKYLFTLSGFFFTFWFICGLFVHIVSKLFANKISRFILFCVSAPKIQKPLSDENFVLVYPLNLSDSRPRRSLSRIDRNSRCYCMTGERQRYSRCLSINPLQILLFSCRVVQPGN